MKRNSQRKTPRHDRSQTTPSVPLKMGNVCQVAEEFRQERRKEAVEAHQQYLKNMPEAHRLGDVAQGCWQRFLEDVYDEVAYANYVRARQDYTAAWIRARPEDQTRILEYENSFPSGFHQAFEQLKRGDVNALESPVQYLEADPWTHYSGYMKQAVIKAILRVKLTDHYIQRLQKIILTVVDKGDSRQEFKTYCRLAVKVDTPDFRRQLNKRFTEVASITDRKEHGYWVRRRAQQVLDSCKFPLGLPAHRRAGWGWDVGLQDGTERE